MIVYGFFVLRMIMFGFMEVYGFFFDGMDVKGFNIYNVMSVGIVVGIFCFFMICLFFEDVL